MFNDEAFEENDFEMIKEGVVMVGNEMSCRFIFFEESQTTVIQFGHH